MFAVIDIETTGISPKSEKITEIAIIIYDGLKVVDEYKTLINPEKYIPKNITRLTGITNDMVKDAPKFWEIAKDIVLLTEGKTFVAHNVSFDYNFVKQEFAELGYKFQREKLCTVKLSRKILPGKKSYSLGKISKELDIEIESRHRAYGDALATVRLLDYLLKIDKTTNRNLKINNRLDNISIIENLPEDTGVYYFHNKDGDVIYIGKSKNIKKRVRSHFNHFSSERSLRMLEQIYDITCEITGSELIALLKESSVIKEFKPVYNKAQRRKASHFFICHHTDEYGYINFSVKKQCHKKNLVASFSSYKEAREYLFRLAETHNLCQKLCGLYQNAGPCFDYHINRCSGACIQKEDVRTYNKRAMALIEYYHFGEENFFIIDKGRNFDENSVVKIENGTYKGFGYFSSDDVDANPGLIHDIIEYQEDNREVRRIINGYLQKNSVKKILRY